MENNNWAWVTECKWTQQDEIETWETECGDMFTLVYDSPKKNQMNYCCFCGKELTEAFIKPSEGSDV